MNKSYIEHAAFHYFECQECGFDSVQFADYSGSELCPLCLLDSGHRNVMTRRVAMDTDRPEGIDQRKVEL
jgi:hypothetical protein